MSEGEGDLQRDLWRHIRGTRPPVLRLLPLSGGAFALGCRLLDRAGQPVFLLDTYALDTGFGAVAGIHLNVVWTDGHRDYVVALVELDDEAQRVWYADGRRDGFILHYFLDDRYVGDRRLYARPITAEVSEPAKVMISNRQRGEGLTMIEDRIIGGEARCLQGSDPQLAKQIYLASAYALLPVPRDHLPDMADAAWLQAVWQIELEVRTQLHKLAASPPVWLLHEEGEFRKEYPVVALFRDAYREFAQGDRRKAQWMRHQVSTRLAREAAKGAWSDLTSLSWDLRRVIPDDSDPALAPLIEALRDDWVLIYLLACEGHQRTHYVVNAPLWAGSGRPYDSAPVLRPLPQNTELTPFWINAARTISGMIGLPFHDLVPEGYVPFTPGMLPTLPDLDPTGDVFETLIESAVADKVYAIFPGSEVLLKAGWISSMFLLELNDAVQLVVTLPPHHFLVAFIRYPRPAGLPPFFFAPVNMPESTRHTLALICASIVRDFFVCNIRERYYDEQILQAPRSSRDDNEGGSTHRIRIVYLPRTRVTYTRRPTVSTLRTERVVSAHHVRGHLRRIEGRPSEQQILAAVERGLAVPEGFTFVRPHHRGSHIRESVYRSASALAILSDVAFEAAEVAQEDLATTLRNAPQSWFAFERAVARLLERRGLLVETTRASRDGGIDIVCVDGTDIVAVQCKFYGRDRRVGESAVRELAGVLAARREFARGMIVTTGSFTRGAIRFAESVSIELVDLAGLAGLLSPEGR